MKLLIIKVGATLILALYATACSQTNHPPENSSANNLPATANTTPTTTTHEPYGLEEILALHRQHPSHKDLPKEWTNVGSVVEKGNLGNHIEGNYCLESKRVSSSNTRSIIVSIYLEVGVSMNPTVVAANALPEAQADAEELKGAERVAKTLPWLRQPPVTALGRTEKWHGYIEVKVRSLCFPTDIR